MPRLATPRIRFQLPVTMSNKPMPIQSINHEPPDLDQRPETWLLKTDCFNSIFSGINGNSLFPMRPAHALLSTKGNGMPAHDDLARQRRTLIDSSDTGYIHYSPSIAQYYVLTYILTQPRHGVSSQSNATRKILLAAIGRLGFPWRQ